MTVRYLGGPLDGTEAVPGKKGWPQYRDENGRTVPTTEGHAEEARMHGPEHPRKYYRLIDDTYVWLPILGKWLRGHIKEAP